MELVYSDMTSALDLKEGVSRYIYEIMSRIYCSEDKYAFDAKCTLSSALMHWKNYKSLYPFKISIVPERSKNIYTSSKYEGKLYNHIAKTKAHNFIFWANWVPVADIDGKVITVLHDLNPLYVLSGKELDSYKQKIKRTISVSDCIVTVSNYSKEDICEKLNCPASKIRVVYGGVNLNNYNSSVSQDKNNVLIKKYSLPDNFFLYFGSTKRNKNILTIIEALQYVSLNGFKFVCSNTEKYLEDYAAKVGVKDKIVFLHGVDEEDKIALYKKARFSIFISKQEGFGLPIIESQASGTPIIVSNASCLPEVAGEGALYVDPDNTKDVADKIGLFLNNPDLLKEYKYKGLQNANKFSFDNSANVFLKIMEDTFI